MMSPDDLLDAYARALSHDPPQEAPAGEPVADGDMVDGARFILDRPATVPAVWGKGTQVLWAEGEALMIAGGQGLGKTTLAGQLVRALLGVGDGAVLGLPVACQGEPVLYLAMDRPRQIARSLGRQFTEADRAALGGLLVRPGPPPADMAAHPLLLAGAPQALGHPHRRGPRHGRRPGIRARPDCRPARRSRPRAEPRTRRRACRGRGVVPLIEARGRETSAARPCRGAPAPSWWTSSFPSGRGVPALAPHP